MENETYISELLEQLNAKGEEQKSLHKKAAEIRDKTVKNKVYFRGLIEFSNICDNDCGYCGISKSKDVKRYKMTKQEILDSAKFCNDVNYGSIVLQSGERQDYKFIDFVEDVVKQIKEKFPKLGITLCVGEQTKEIFQRFFDAGAHRYLLRIETSDKKHYERLHPANMSFDTRKQCLKDLKDIGFQVGTGVMINSPFQTIENLAKDLLFFKEIDVDMVGMGPYLRKDVNADLDLSLNMIAALRILMPNINIASTTALQVLNPIGRELGLKAGANIIMPITTPTKYRNQYLLYDDKPCINETSEECLGCITQRIKSTGLTPAFGEWGDSLNYANRQR
jgi:biotin synthase